MAAHLQAVQYCVHRDHWLTSKIHLLQHSKVYLLLHNLHKVNKYPISKSLHFHKPILNNRMLHHCNLLHQHPSHFSSLLLHTNNSSHCYSPQYLAHMLHISSKISHNLYNPGLAPKANPSGNQGNHHHLDKVLIFLHSLSFHLQRHNKILCPTPRSLETQRLGVKNISTLNKICFRCKQPGHFKKDCPKQPFCFRCRTRGHIPVKCPLKKQGRQQLEERCKSVNQGTDKRHETEKTGKGHMINHSTPT